MSNTNKQSCDSLGHIRIAVSDFEASQDFYGKLFTRLGFFQIDKKAWASPEGLGIWLIQAAHPQHTYVFEAPGLHHLCLKAKSKREVDEVYDFLIVNHISVVAFPKFYPQYTMDYYAVFFLDPGGIELEVAFY